MLTIDKIIKGLKEVKVADENSPDAIALTTALNQLGELKKNFIVKKASNAEELNDHHVSVVKQLLLTSDPLGVMSVHYHPNYTEAIRYWAAMKDVTIKQAAWSIYNIYTSSVLATPR